MLKIGSFLTPWPDSKLPNSQTQKPPNTKNKPNAVPKSLLKPGGVAAFAGAPEAQSLRVSSQGSVQRLRFFFPGLLSCYTGFGVEGFGFYTHILMHTSTDLYANIPTHTYLNLYIYIYIYLFIYSFIYLFTYAFMYEFIKFFFFNICRCTLLYICIHTYKQPLHYDYEPAKTGTKRNAYRPTHGTCSKRNPEIS